MKRFKTIEIIYYIACIIILTVTAVVLDTGIPAYLSTALGITGACLNTKAMRMSFVFSAASALLYGIISFTQKLYGEALLNVIYCVPVYVLAFIRWKGEGKAQKDRMFSMRKKQILYMLLIIAAGTALYGYALKVIGSNLPVLNALATMVCAAAIYLASRRMIQQWYVWITHNAVSVIMWCLTLNMSNVGYSILAYNILFVTINLSGLFRWRRIMSSKNNIEQY